MKINKVNGEIIYKIDPDDLEEFKFIILRASHEEGIPIVDCPRCGYPLITRQHRNIIYDLTRIDFGDTIYPKEKYYCRNCNRRFNKMSVENRNLIQEIIKFIGSD
jgi:DNA-directed RNA polymerase subunit RPC12/RpoP